MEACGSAHQWGRELQAPRHDVGLIAPHYVKPFLKHQKNDAADAEAIVEAALRPTMRFEEPKSAHQQARAVAFRTREQLVKQRAEAVNALRSHLYDFGHVAPEAIGYLPRFAKVIDDPSTEVPELARDICKMLLDQIAQLTARIDALKARIAAMSQEADMPRQLQTMPGRRPDHLTRGRDLRPADGAVPAWAGLRRLARPGAATAFQRRKAEAGEDLEDGAT
jgi:transposase